MALRIVADDLTGAADCAARCQRAGLAAAIVVEALTWQGASSLLPGIALAFNLDSRHLPPQQAAEKTRRMLAHLVASGAATRSLWYKKIDSTLRGNIGAEIEAMLPLATPAGLSPCAVISPAFPAQKRGLVEGGLVYEHQTAPRHLPTMLAEQCSLAVASIQLHKVQEGTEHLAAQMAALYRQGAQILVVDGLSDDDLQTTLAAVGLAVPHALLCGSAGLVLPLAAMLTRQKDAPHPPFTQPRPVGGATLAVVGSGSLMAHRQIAALAQTGQVHILEVGYDGQLIRTSANPEHAQGWLLHLPKPDAKTPLDGAAARSLAATLAQTAQRIFAQERPGALILVGGDTAQLVLSQLGIEQLQVVAELFAGIPQTVARLVNGDSLLVALKAGNHGDEETLGALWSAI